MLTDAEFDAVNALIMDELCDHLKPIGITEKPRLLAGNNCYRVTIDKEQAAALEQKNKILSEIAEELSTRLGVKVTYSTTHRTGKGKFHHLDFDLADLIAKHSPKPAPEPDASAAARPAPPDVTMAEAEGALGADASAAAARPAPPRARRSNREVEQQIIDALTRHLNAAAKSWSPPIQDFQDKFKINVGRNFVFVDFNEGSLSRTQLFSLYKACRLAAHCRFDNQNVNMKSTQTGAPFFKLSVTQCRRHLAAQARPITTMYEQSLGRGDGAGLAGHHDASASAAAAPTRRYR